MRQYPVKLKDCMRCKGDLGFFDDQYGKYWDCLQCGQHYYLNSFGNPRRELPKIEKQEYNKMRWSWRKGGSRRFYLGE